MFVGPYDEQSRLWIRFAGFPSWYPSLSTAMYLSWLPALWVKDLVPCQQRGEAIVKGVHFPIKVYEPVGDVRAS